VAFWSKRPRNREAELEVAKEDLRRWIAGFNETLAAFAYHCERLSLQLQALDSDVTTRSDSRQSARITTYAKALWRAEMVCKLLISVRIHHVKKARTVFEAQADALALGQPPPFDDVTGALQLPDVSLVSGEPTAFINATWSDETPQSAVSSLMRRGFELPRDEPLTLPPFDEWWNVRLPELRQANEAATKKRAELEEAKRAAAAAAAEARRTITADQPAMPAATDDPRKNDPPSTVATLKAERDVGSEKTVPYRVERQLMSNGNDQVTSGRKQHSPAESTQSAISNSRRRVFVVHGHDMSTLARVESVIHRLGCHPVIFSRIGDKGAKTNIEILEHTLPACDAVVALLTPDDEGRSIGAERLRRRARQNVLVEAGYAIISKRHRSLIVTIGDVEIPSDFDGINRVHGAVWDDAMAFELARRLVAYLSLRVELLDF
jgi:hypothetical protein